MTDIQKENKSGGKVPNLRFPNFYGEWEVKKLGDVAEKVNSGKTPLGGDAVYTNEGVLFIRSQNVNNDKLELENSVFIPESVNIQMKNSVVKPHDILLNITGASLGRSCVVPENFKIGNVNQHVCIVRLTQNYNPRFVQPILSSNKGQTIFNSLQTGSGREGLNFESIKGIKLFFPDKNEQTKIATFLSLIDERIQTQSKIIEGLKKLKVATAKKIFSQEFRFKDDKGNDFSEWEEILLGEVMSIPEKTKAQNIDKNKLLTVKLHLKGVLKNDNTDTLSFGATNYFIRKKGQFIYGKQNLFNGAFDIIPDEFDGFLSSGDVPTLEINNSKINSSFLLYLMGRKEFYKPLEDFATGSGSKRIHEKTLLGIKIPFPSLPEQTKIVNFLSAIDSKIDMETQLLQKLEEQKKFLLQNMFV